LVVELDDLEQLLRHVAAHGSLDEVVVEGVDLSDETDLVLSVTCRGATFLGAGLTPAAMTHVVEGGGVVFPRLGHLPFDPYRPRLYTQGELLVGWDPDVPGSFGDALDSVIHRWASRHPRGSNVPVLDALAQRLHDHAIDEALGDHLAEIPDVVAVMGGHGLLRTDATYGVVAELARAMARTGWHIASGGGPGAMEAANLGAWLSAGDDGDLRRALATLAREARFDATDEYLRAGQTVLDEFGDGVDSLAVPTWFYGHEPTNQFATHVAKYFANSIREDGLLAIATRGVVFAPGSAGTVQEVFQDATQNHYEVFGVVSPMVFLDTDYWRSTLGAEPLLRQLAARRPYASMIGVADTAAEAVEFLHSHPPLPA
jgi:predicted Rossmann-fold nucleotide-binding protein